MPARHVPLGCEANAAVARLLGLSAAGAASYRETGAHRRSPIALISQNANSDLLVPDGEFLKRHVDLGPA